MAYGIGSLVVFAVKFLDAAGADADPSTVQLYIREEVDGTELFWVYTGGVATVTPSGLNPIVKDSVGDYHVNFVTRKPERLTAQFTGSGTIFQTTAQTAFVRHSGITAIDHP